MRGAQSFRACFPYYAIVVNLGSACPSLNCPHEALSILLTRFACPLQTWHKYKNHLRQVCSFCSATKFIVPQLDFRVPHLKNEVPQSKMAVPHTKKPVPQPRSISHFSNFHCNHGFSSPISNSQPLGIIGRKRILSDKSLRNFTEMLPARFQRGI